MAKCPNCGKEFPNLDENSPQFKGHLNGHKGGRGKKKGGVSQTPVSKGVTKVTFSVKGVEEQGNLPEFKGTQEVKPKSQVEAAAQEGLADIVQVLGDMWNEFIEGKAEPFTWSKQDSERIGRAIVLLDNKYHFGAGMAEGYFPEIFAALVIAVVGLKVVRGLRARGKAGYRAGYKSAEEIARANESTDQSTDKAFSIFSDPEVAAGIQEAFNNARGETEANSI